MHSSDLNQASSQDVFVFVLIQLVCYQSGRKRKSLDIVREKRKEQQTGKSHRSKKISNQRK